MSTVSVRDLRNSGGEVVDRVQAGERLTITRDGRPVAQLVALPRQPMSLDDIIRRRAKLPDVEPVALRRDIDALIDPGLYS